MSLATYDSLRLTQETYYQRYRFADVFANLKRAPLRLARQIERIPGVARAETRVVFDVTLDVPGMEEPVTGRLISVPPPSRRQGTLNDVAILGGRYPEPERAGEALVNQGFADAHDLGPGDSVTAVINGRRQELEIVGVAESPEYVYNVRAGDILPDDRRFGLFWMNRDALAPALDMEGAFNDVSLTLMHGASEAEVIARLDRLLAPYGGLGAIPRKLQISHWWLDDQLKQLRQSGKVVPVIFFGVAAFLLNVVLSRIVAVQRGQIAALKALGYSNAEIGRHYMGWGLLITALGGLVGIAGGAWLGKEMVRLQNDFFSFPFLLFRLSPQLILGAVAASFVAAILGAQRAVRNAVSLPPAEAMHPEPPGTFRESWIERVGLQRLLSQPTRMILRNLRSKPLRALSSVIGIAASVAILIVGMFSLDGMDEMLDVQFNVAQRQDLTVTFVNPVSGGALHELESMLGVVDAEPMRAVPVRLRYGHRSRRSAITGIPENARLNRVIDASLTEIVPPPEGLVLSTTLADLLEVGPGDEVTVEVLEGPRPVRRVQVAHLVEEYMGMAAYMRIDALRRMMHEGPTLSGAYLMVDSAHLDRLYRRLKETPAVAGVTLKKAAIENFDKIIQEWIGLSIFFNVLFATIIAFGVVYNTARTSLSERSRELASLRVLGFTRGEISYILLGELALLTLVAIPVGFLLGYGLSALTVTAFATEVYRVPLVILPRTYAFGAVTVLVASALSALAVRRRLDNLDLVEVLKTRE
jgi:putative ABC transport system permease protein